MNDTAAADEDLTLDPWVGHVLSGRYRLVAAIGAGGMGVVYRAWDLANDGYVVVKMPKRELLGEPKFLQRFEQELSALRALSHPAVVPVIDVGNEQGTPYAVMPYLAGGSLKLRRLFTQEGQAAPEAPANLWRWLPAVAKALDFVHSNGYVHRDVKPDNILFDGPGTPFLSDFGVAKIVLQAEDETASRGLTGTGLALGTPAYMAPELISGAKPSPPVDQYALAVTVYELLAARKPFDGPTPAAVILAHVTGNAPALASLLPALPPQLSEAVARGMAREPADRFGSCVEFASAALAAVPRPSAAEKLQLMCPQCSRLLNVKPDWAGKQGNCPRCKSAMAIGADLKSLWLEGDRLGTPPASETVPVRVLGPTPSLPVAIPKPPRPMKPTKPESVIEVLKEQFLGSKILKAVAAGVVALCVALVAPPFFGVERLPDKPRAITRADAAVAKKITPKPNTDSETEARANPKPPDQDQLQQQEPEPQQDQIAQEPAGVTEPRRPRIARGSKQMQTTQPVQEKYAETGEPSSPPDAEPVTVSAAPEVVETKPQADLQRPAPQSSLPVPPDEDVAKVIATFREAYEDQYASAKENGKYSALTGRLETVLEETQDPAQRYALLVEAEELGVNARDLGRAMGFLDKRIEQYEVDPAPLRLALIKKFATQKKVQPTQQLFEDSLLVASQAVERDDFEVAQAAGQLAVGTAKTLDRLEKAASAKQRMGRGKPSSASGTSQYAKEANAVIAAIRSQTKFFEAYKQAREQLASDPANQAANTTAGRYLCLIKQDWEAGLPALAKGTPGRLRELAERAAAVSASHDTKQGLELAGDWWTLAESNDADLEAMETAAIKQHASRSYAALLEKIEDPTDRALAEKRAGDELPTANRGQRTLADLAEREASRGGRPGKRSAKSPIFAVVPEPRGLSDEIYPLLPTAEELEVISNHLNVDSSAVEQARNGFLKRMYTLWDASKWTPTDAAFIIMVNDAFNARLNEATAYTPKGSLWGSRESAGAHLASYWILAAVDERDFVLRARAVPAAFLRDLDYRISDSEMKQWFRDKSPRYDSDREKAAALDFIIGSGLTFRGVLEIRKTVAASMNQ